MKLLAIFYATFHLAPAPAVIDTPPAPPSIERLAQLRTMQDVIAVAMLADGSPAPSDLVLPELLNRRHTLEFMRVHYPESMRQIVTNSMPIAWVLVDDEGSIAEAQLLTSSGHAPLDSLSVRVLQIASFQPAQHDGKSVAVWIPLPARVPPLKELLSALETSDLDRSEAPTETPYTQKPVLLNRMRVEAAIIRVIHQVNQRVVAMNEAFARSQRIGGTAHLWVYIDAEGVVRNTILKKTSGNSDLDTAAHDVARMMRFSPAKNGDRPVDAWLEVPIHFKAQ